MVKTIINKTKKEQLKSIYKGQEDVILIFIKFKSFKDSTNKHDKYW